MNPLSHLTQAGSARPTCNPQPLDTHIQASLDEARQALAAGDRPYHAARLFEAVLCQQNGNLEAILGAAQAWFEDASYSLAHFHFESALDLEPTCPEALIGIAKTLQKTEDQEAALSFLIEKAPPAILAFAENPAQMIDQLQRITEPLGDGLEDVMIDITEAIEPTFLQVARTLFQNDQKHDALAIYDILIEHGSETLDTWLARSDTLLALGRTADAAESRVASE